MEMLCKYIVVMRFMANSSLAFWKCLKKIFGSILTHGCRTRGQSVLGGGDRSGQWEIMAL